MDNKLKTKLIAGVVVAAIVGGGTFFSFQEHAAINMTPLETRMFADACCFPVEMGGNRDLVLALSDQVAAISMGPPVACKASAG